MACVPVYSLFLRQKHENIKNNSLRQMNVLLQYPQGILFQNMLHMTL